MRSWQQCFAPVRRAASNDCCTRFEHALPRSLWPCDCLAPMLQRPGRKRPGSGGCGLQSSARPSGNPPSGVVIPSARYHGGRTLKAKLRSPGGASCSRRRACSCHTAGLSASPRFRIAFLPGFLGKYPPVSDLVLHSSAQVWSRQFKVQPYSPSLNVAAPVLVIGPQSQPGSLRQLTHTLSPRMVQRPVSVPYVWSS